MMKKSVILFLLAWSLVLCASAVAEIMAPMSTAELPTSPIPFELLPCIVSAEMSDHIITVTLDKPFDQLQLGETFSDSTCMVELTCYDDYLSSYNAELAATEPVLIFEIPDVVVEDYSVELHGTFMATDGMKITYYYKNEYGHIWWTEGNLCHTLCFLPDGRIHYYSIEEDNISYIFSMDENGMLKSCTLDSYAPAQSYSIGWNADGEPTVATSDFYFWAPDTGWFTYDANFNRYDVDEPPTDVFNPLTLTPPTGLGQP